MSKEVKIGNLGVGGKNPVRIKGMLKTPAKDTKKLVAEAKLLQTEGAEAIRVAVKEEKDAKLAILLRGQIGLPLVADIHFHHRLALLAIEAGFDGIRLNPLNIHRKEEVRSIAQAAKAKGISLRVGINSGGFKKNFTNPLSLAKDMVKACEGYLDILEKEKFFDIMVSLKGSNVVSTILANRLFSQKRNYPLHLGITATGPFSEGVVKSSVGLGSLLQEGIGNVMRVSLTGPSFWEIRTAKQILQALNLRQFGCEIISCPTCSRCEVDLISIVDRFQDKLKALDLKQPLRIALMGCVVNGPGEAYQADLGVAFGKKRAVIFKKDKILKRTSEAKVITDLIMEVKQYGLK